MPEKSDPAARRPLKSRSTAWARWLCARLVGAGVSPNAISLAGIGFAGAGAALLLGASGDAGVSIRPLLLILAAVCVQARLLCNLMDGLVAVEGGVKSRAGELFNEAPDRIADVLFLVAAGYACGHPVLGWLCAVLAVTTAYLRALGASMGLGQDYSGPGAKPHRMAVLTGGLVAEAALGWSGAGVEVLMPVLGILAVLTAVTVVRRTLRMYRRLP